MHAHASSSSVKMHSGKAADPRATHVSTSGDMFYIIFGATARLHIAQVQLLIKNLHLESRYTDRQQTSGVGGPVEAQGE